MSVESNIKSLMDHHIIGSRVRAIKWALKKSTNAALNGATKLAASDLQARINLRYRSSDGKKPGFTNQTKKKPATIRSMKAEGAIFSANIEMTSLVHKVVGKQKPRKQKGLSRGADVDRSMSDSEKSLSH